MLAPDELWAVTGGADSTVVGLLVFIYDRDVLDRLAWRKSVNDMLLGILV